MARIADSMAILQLCRTPLSDAYFSESNLDVVQARLAKTVRDKTGFTIGRQSDVEVAGVMRGVFQAYSDNDGGRKEIMRLNSIALEILAEQVVAGVQGYVTYVRDASTMPEPMARGTFASIKGERTLEYKIGM
jgi:hypothetical protein